MEGAAIDSTSGLAYPGADLLDGISDAVAIVDADDQVVYANPAARSMGAPALPPEVLRLGALARQTGRPVESVEDGWWRRVTPAPAGGFTLVARSANEQDPAAALQQAEIRLRALFENAPADMLVLQVGHDGTVVIERPNAAFCRSTGLDAASLVGRPLDTAMEPATAEILAADARICLAQGGLECQNTLVFPVGQRLVKAYYRSMVGGADLIQRVLLTQIDLTENRRIEMALRQALRLEVVGQLTGGVAHDFNNLLTAVLGSLELLARVVTDPRQSRWVQVATEAAQRGATLTQQLLAYARKQFLAPTSTNIPEALGGMTELIRGSLGSRIVLETQFDPGTWLAHTDIAQLELALLNLMVNARTAMPSGGQLRLTTHNHFADAPGTPRELEPGDYVVLTVADTGIGMPPDILAHAMEPFFTTKGVGEGSGLGLSQAYGFARQLGGTVRLTSEVGVGTSAEIFLPRAAPVKSVPLRLLVVDGDDGTRRATVALLRDQGWVADEAPGAAGAIEHLTAGSYDVLVVDLEMGVMSGAHLSRRAQAVHPKLRSVFLTREPDPAFAAGLPGPVVPKRMAEDLLVQAVHAALRPGDLAYG